MPTGMLQGFSLENYIFFEQEGNKKKGKKINKSNNECKVSGGFIGYNRKYKNTQGMKILKAMFYIPIF